MELRHLRYFVAVAEELHFGRAAQRLHLTQPPLSQAVRDLEDELGARLFERSSRAVGLTPAGEAFLRHAREILERAGQAAEEARRIHQGQAGPVSVGYMNPVMEALLCRALAAYSRELPGVRLRLRELSSPAQLEELRAGRLDLAFIRLAGQDLQGLESVVLLREPYLLALPAGHELARLRAVPLRRAGEHPFILSPAGRLPELDAALAAAFEAAGTRLRIAQEAQSKHAALALTAAGLGLCLVPASTRDWLPRGVVLRPVLGVLPEVVMAAAWREGRLGPAGRRLVEFARAVVAGA